MEWELVVSISIQCVVTVAIYMLMLVGVKFLFQKPRGSLPPNCKGFAAPGWNRVAEEFKRQIMGRHYGGGGFAVYHKGQLVVEFVGGYADYEPEILPWDKTTLSCLYDCTRGIAAIVIAILVDRGLLDYSSRVADYWPEFAANGKESITVEQLLSQQAGLIVLDEVYSFFDIVRQPDKMSHLLATARPQWEPGTAHGSHSVTIGLYMDQLVRRVDPQHRSLDQFFAEEVSKKFGIDCFIGLPIEQNYRCARFQRVFSLSFLFHFLMTPKNWLCVRMLIPGSNAMKICFNNSDMYKPLHNDPAFREIPCAATNGFATVAGLAKLYGILANGGRHENQALLSPSGVEKLNEPLVSGIDSVAFEDATFGRGTIIMKSEDGHNIFGHPGLCGQAGFADPKHRIGWACTSNFLIFFDRIDWRYRQLIESVYETVRELEQQEDTD